MIQTLVPSDNMVSKSLRKRTIRLPPHEWCNLIFGAIEQASQHCEQRGHNVHFVSCTRLKYAFDLVGV